MEYRLIHPPTPYELEVIEMLTNSRQRELAKIAISIAQEYGFVRRANLDAFDNKYTRHDVTRVLKHLKDNGLLKDGFVSKYPKGTLKGYEPVHRKREVTLLFITLQGHHYEETSFVSRYYYQVKGLDMHQYLTPTINELKNEPKDILEGIY